MKRELPFEQNLYQDAIRRRENLIKKKQEDDKNKNKPNEKQYKNEKSDQYVVRKFNKELIRAITELQLREEKKEDDPAKHYSIK